MNLSILRIYKRNLVVVSAAIAALLIVQLFVFAYFQLRADQQRELEHESVMLAGQINLGSVTSYKDILQQAVANPRLAIACMLDPKNNVMAATPGRAAGALGLTQDNTVQACQFYAQSPTTHSALIARAQVSDPKLPRAAGSVLLVASPSGVWEHFGARLLLFVTLLLGFIGLVWWQGQQLLRLLVRPMQQIATTAQRVTLYKDYSLRVSTGALVHVPQEIDQLIEAFNAMLKEVEDRDARLTRKTMELEKSKQQADAANAAKSQFLAHVSHELRTPLNAIIGFSTMLVNQHYGQLGNEKYVEYARDIHESGKHLLDIINDILDLSRAESGKLSVKFEYLPVVKIVEKAVSIIASQAQQARVDVYTDIPDRLPKIVADRVRLVQILLHLLSNAIKFTPEGGKVTVRVRAEAGRGDVQFFTLEVADTGIGMTDDQIRNAFVSFNQAEGGLNRKSEGAGLGLPLTKRLVELHHGKIKIESIKDRGTTVSVRLTSDPGLLD